MNYPKYKVITIAQNLKNKGFYMRVPKVYCYDVKIEAYVDYIKPGKMFELEKRKTMITIGEFVVDYTTKNRELVFKNIAKGYEKEAEPIVIKLLQKFVGLRLIEEVVETPEVEEDPEDIEDGEYEDDED